MPVMIPRHIEPRVPVPPFEVQREIVRIMCHFTQMEARRRQYEYHRDKLLTFKELAA